MVVFENLRVLNEWKFNQKGKHSLAVNSEGKTEVTWRQQNQLKLFLKLERLGIKPPARLHPTSTFCDGAAVNNIHNVLIRFLLLIFEQQLSLKRHRRTRVQRLLLHFKCQNSDIIQSVRDVPQCSSHVPNSRHCPFLCSHSQTCCPLLARCTRSCCPWKSELINN